MKKLATLFFVLFSIALYAQPANDDCVGLIDLGDAPICPSPATYTNVDATESDIGNDNIPSCFNTTPERDVWFAFSAVPTIDDYQITVSGITMTQPQIAVYRGDCEFDGLVLLDCAAANVGENEVSITLTGLTPGLSYFLRINDWSVSATPNWGTFELCVEEFVDVIYTIDEAGSTECEGTLYDTGGPNGEYNQFETNSFTICPDDPQSCIIMNVANYNLSLQGTNLTFYDGANIASPVIGNIAGGANGDTQGGVCYEVVATSGCLTVEMNTFFGTAEGFEANWSCSNDCPTEGNIEIEVGPSVSEVQDALQNEFMDITVTNINCANEAYGLFSQGDETSLGMGEGLLLTTGSAAEVANPASVEASNNLNLPGDPELDELNNLFGLGFTNTNDACFVELEVTPKTNNITFEYVFGSDEYKFQFSPFSDDLIGILLGGPGVVGEPTLDNQVNLADLPTVPDNLVSIQSLNASTNWEYYRNNTNSQSIVYNGLTSGFLGNSKTLLADRLVTPCETYQVKIAIADTDENDDSGLFVNPTLSFQPTVSINPNTGISYLVEGCVDIQSVVNLEIPEPLVAPTSFDIEIGGTAQEGDDYTVGIPSTVTFPTGVTILSYPITIIDDGVAEGTETITISMTQDFGCGEVVMATETINLEDELNVQIVPFGDTLFVCDGINSIQLQGTGAGGYQWAPANIFDDPTGFTPTATVTSSQQVTLTGTLGTCTNTDEVFLQLVDPQIDIQADGPITFCQGEAVTLTANNNVNNSGLTWEPTIGLSNPGSSTTIASPFATTTYTATVTTATGGCSASDEITITVEPFNFPEMVLEDTTICQGQSVQLATPVQNSSTIFEWTPDTWLDDATIPNAIATPEETTTYTLNATSPSGTCTGTAEVTVTVLPADVEIVPETLELCLGDSVQIDATTSTGGTGLVWSPTDSLTLINDETVIVYPEISTWYYATLTVGACTVSDSVFVRVDSLPVLDIEAIPFKESYCQGENISLVSPNYDFIDFIDMQFQWEPPTGVISEDTLFNLVINATETTSYIRTTTNNGCFSQDTIEIVVTPVANITVTPESPEICPGDGVDLLATADQPIDEWMWSPEIGLSCTDCPDPTASPPSTVTYQVTGEFMGCPSTAQVQVEVITSPFSPGANFICQGSSASINTVNNPDATYEWTSSDGTFTSNEAQPVVSPSQTTTYNLVATLNGCVFEESITVVVAEAFSISIDEIAVTCPGEPVTITVNSTSPNVTYQWSGPVSGTGPSITWDNPDVTSTFTVVVSDLNQPDPCFVETASVTIDVSPEFSVNIDANPAGTVTGGEEVTLTTQTDAIFPTFDWTTGSSEQTIVVSSCETTDYGVTVTDANGCSQVDVVTVDVANSFSIEEDSSFVLAVDSLPIYEGEEFQIGIQTNPSNLFGFTYSWYLGEVGGEPVSTTSDTISEILNAPEIDTESELFIYTVVMEDAFGCQAIDTIHVTVFDNPVRIPNVFTPNGDGVNDNFLPVSPAAVEIMAFQVWNRWGQLVYENENPDLGWDGTQDGEPAISDTYVYRIAWKIRGGDRDPIVEKGDVTLLR